MTLATLRSFVFSLLACCGVLLLPSRPAAAAEPSLEEEPAQDLVPSPPLGDGAPPPAPAREVECRDRIDNDGDVVVDCGDADCQTDPACRPDLTGENDEQRCSDWIDNDQDGVLDCDDIDCSTTVACRGSYDHELAGGAPPRPAATGTPRLTIEDEAAIAQQYGDKDGERDNLTCSDGIDNDDDGRVDCDDLGCRLDTQVMVCQPASGFRLSVVARVVQSYDVQERQADTEISDLQLRLLGQIPFIQNSFFLVSSRVEKTPRVTFAMFQIPLGKKGHYVNVNSGGGSLSIELLHSVHKRLLADPAYYVYNAFEQGNGAAVEFGGPMDKHGRFLYRTYLAGGSGRYAGNIGGKFFPDDNLRNFTWTVGAQAWMNLVGFYSRWDSPFLYMPAPLTVAFAIGAKYDQRAQERYPAVNAQFVFRWSHVHLTAESYTKRELAFKNWQTAYNVQLGILVVKRRLLLAGDFGQYLATEFEDPPQYSGYDLRRQLGELQYRAAAHVYLWRDVFFATLIWRDQRQEPGPNEEGIQVAQDARLMLTYRW